MTIRQPSDVVSCAVFFAHYPPLYYPPLYGDTTDVVGVCSGTT